MFRTMAGGSIEMLTPGGGLQVAALGTAVDPGYGLVTLGQGDINLFARNSVTVNRSRILTFGGGDEIIWSTLGDIDAGRGAKTARVPSAPEVVTDFDSVTRVLEKADISGSGIGTIIGFSGVEEGDVHLIAPLGTVNAGDAGIRVAGNLNLAALHVVNAANIEVGGKSKGIRRSRFPISAAFRRLRTRPVQQRRKRPRPPNQSSPASSPPSLSSRSSATEGAMVLRRNGAQEKDRRSNLDTYDPNSAVHMLGNGTLSHGQLQKLTAEEGDRLEALTAQ